MSIKCYPLAKSLEATFGENGPESKSQTYVVEGTSDEVAVTFAVLNVTTPTVQGYQSELIRRPFRLQEVGYQTWHVDVKYDKTESSGGGGGEGGEPQPLSFKIGWDTTGETTKVTLSKGVVFSGGDVPDNYPVIGWDGKKVNGVDVPVAALVLTADVWYHPNAIGPAIVKFWASYTPSVNADSWLGFDPGELLYVGNNGEETFSFTAQGRQLTLVPVRYKFIASQNINQPFSIGDELQVPGKLGWDYLDVFYGEKVVNGGGVSITVPTPLRYKVHRMFNFVSFRALTGIG
jgi:hypothetical protein